MQRAHWCNQRVEQPRKKLMEIRLLVNTVVANLDLSLQFALEATPDDFSLTRFQSIHHRRYWTDVVSHREQDQLLVNKLRIRNFFQTMIQVCSMLKLSEPLLTDISFFLAESQFDELAVTILGWGKGYHMLFHMTEIIPSIGVGTCSQTLRRLVQIMKW